jgi:hypothetical protein
VILNKINRFRPRCQDPALVWLMDSPALPVRLTSHSDTHALGSADSGLFEEFVLT